MTADPKLLDDTAEDMLAQPLLEKAGHEAIIFDGHLSGLPMPEIASELKHYVKSQPHEGRSLVIWDRRTDSPPGDAPCVNV